MRIVVEREGSVVPVDVAPGLDSVALDGKQYPVVVVRTTATLVELEIAGEKVIVEQWPEHFESPPATVDVNGERWTVRIERGPAPSTGATRVANEARPSAVSSPPLVAAPPGGLAIVPPMPGKVIEIRVKDGDRVAKGDVLLVLEAMKMRNELASPADGVVRGVAVQPGTNARTKEPMMFVVPT
jgi:glutaconyl-CoA/methylmalonyl-CoA decarboxylase subunit gamma